MGKLTGFMEYRRELPAERPIAERVGDWEEFRLTMPEEALREQGARCMDCAIPFCHTGEILRGATVGCPIHNLIPEWNDLVYRGFWKEALARLHQTNNFPEFTGRVCPAPCEGSCVLGISDPAVTIKNIEKAIIDRGWENGWVAPEPPKFRTGKKAAVVGSGPAGLCAAAQLNRAGHEVTVFERADRPGGLLMYGIPNMKLDKRKVVLRRVRQMEAGGIRFVCGVEVGRNYRAIDLRKEFDVVALCVGATRPRDLSLEGRKLGGVHFAMDFLAARTQAALDGRGKDAFISAEGKDVIIVGGGDTGTDCAGAAMRHGCRSLAQIEILPRPPLARADDNPWPEWPKIYRVEYSHEEAAARFGADPRSYLTTVKEFVGDSQGRLKEVLLAQVRWTRNAAGRVAPEEIPGSEKALPAQLALLATGFVGPEERLLDSLGVERDSRGNAKADFEKYQTNIEGVFAAGDCRRGQSLVVWAFNEGRGVARECDLYLTGRPDLP